MAIKALSKVAPDWYTPESECEIDRDAEGNIVGKKSKPDATRFKLRPLTPPEKESVTEFDGKAFNIPPRNFGEVLKFGIVDWENFPDENGKPIRCSVVNHWRIPSDIRLELAGEILIRSNVSEDEAKN